MTTICITGASSGIGKAFAELLAEKENHLIITARRKNLLEELKKEVTKKGCTVTIIVADLTKKNHVDALAEKLISLNVDVLINNAGFGEYTAFAESKTSEDMLAVNVTALTTLTRKILPSLIKKNTGGILNVSSVAGFMPGPKMAVYFATKSYVISFTEALAEELKNTQLKVSCLCPGATESEFFKVAHTKNLGKGNLPSALDVASYGWKAFSKNKTIAVYGIMNKLAVITIRLLPRKIVRKITSKVL